MIMKDKADNLYNTTSFTSFYVLPMLLQQSQHYASTRHDDVLAVYFLWIACLVLRRSRLRCLLAEVRNTCIRGIRVFVYTNRTQRESLFRWVVSLANRTRTMDESSTPRETSSPTVTRAEGSFLRYLNCTGVHRFFTDSALLSRTRPIRGEQQDALVLASPRGD